MCIEEVTMSQEHKDSIPHQHQRIREWSDENVVKIIREFVDRGDARRSDEKIGSTKIVKQGYFVPRTSGVRRPRRYAMTSKRKSLLAKIRSFIAHRTFRKASSRQP